MEDSCPNTTAFNVTCLMQLVTTTGYFANSANADDNRISLFEKITFCVELILLVFHISVLFFVLAQMRKLPAVYKAAFFKLYVIHSCANYFCYSTLLYNRLKAYGALWTCNACEVSFQIVYQFAAFFQLLTYTLIAYNRFTAIVQPLQHIRLWKDAWLYRWVAVISLLALLFGLPRPLALLERHLVNPEESFKDGWSAAGYFRAASNSLGNFIVSVVDGVLEVWTLVVYQKMDIPRKLKHLENYHLLIYTMLGMIFQVIKVVYYGILSVKLNTPLLDDMASYAIIAQALIGPIFLFMTSKNIRLEYLAFYGLRAIKVDDLFMARSVSNTAHGP